MKLIQALGRSSDSLTLDQMLATYFSYNGLSYPVLNQTIGSNRAEEIGADFQGIVEGAYRQNGVVFACLMVRQLLFQEARFQFRRFKSGRPGEYFGTRDLLPLEHPWPNATTGDLLARAIQDVDLAGNWYGARIGDTIRRLRPDYITIVMGSKVDPDHAGVAPDADVLGYIYDPPSGKSVVYLPEQIAHFAPYPDPQANFRGMSWLTPVIREIMADQAATTHKLKFFEQGATPNMVVSFDPAVDAEKVAKWIEMMEANIGGAANAYRTLYLGGGADAKPVGSSMREIGFKDVQGAGETRIAAAAGVPPVIVGLSEGLQAATYSNYSQARRRFADGTMRPLWRNFAGSVASIIRVPAASDLWYDDRDIPFLAEDVKDAAEVQAANSQSIKALTEAGYDPTSVVEAITAGDLNRLTHTGLFSVQLQQPGAGQPALPPGRMRMRAKDKNPPGEADLRAIKGRFNEAEAEIRRLIGEAIDGNADALRDQALTTLDDLRAEKVSDAVQGAYAQAYDHAADKISQGRAASTDPVGGLADSLETKLASALDTAQRNVKSAFADVNPDNLDDKEAEAVTGHVDEAGRAWPVGAWAAMQITTLGRRATSRGVKDAAAGGLVQVSEHGTTHPVCAELEGEIFPAADAPEPPFHEGCEHMLIPVPG